MTPKLLTQAIEDLRQSGKTSQREKEIIEKIASILVDLVIEEQRQQLLQSQK